MKIFFSKDMIVFIGLITVVIVDLGLNIFSNHTLFFKITQFPDLNATQGWAERGQWGDVLSGHFSALAFLAVAYTVYLQKQELRSRSNFDSFKMALELINDIKQHSIILTSKTNIPLTISMEKLLLAINTKEKLEIVNFHSNTKHDILQIEAFIEALKILQYDLSEKQITIIFKKLSLITTEYQLIAQMFFWSSFSLQFELPEKPLCSENEESAIIKKICKLGYEVHLHMKQKGINDYSKCFENSDILEPYNEQINKILFEKDI